MEKFYSFAKRATTALAVSLSLYATPVFAQVPICGPIVENFNNPGNGMGGFSSTTVNSNNPGLTYNGSTFLQRCNVPSSNTVYQLVTPTYRTRNNQTEIGYGFLLSGAIKISTVAVFAQYINNSGDLITVQIITPFTPSYDNPGPNGVATICNSFPFAPFQGFDAGDTYRFVIQLTTASASANANQCLTFDDFRTTGDGNQAPLPVYFTGLSTKKVSNGIQITWTVAAEQNVNRYEVEKSTADRSFTSIGSVAATNQPSYSFTDAGASSGTVYYRIRNVDNDGKFKYSSVVKLQNGQAAIVLKIFPQPAANQLTVQHPAIRGNATLTLSSADGRVVRSRRLTQGLIQSELDLNGLQGGIYLLRFDNGEGAVETLKVVKQ